jgi:hypothetical protein
MHLDSTAGYDQQLIASSFSVPVSGRRCSYFKSNTGSFGLSLET